MANRKARSEFLKLARIADYSAELARKLANAGNEAERREAVQSLKRSLKREEEQFAAIMRYLNRTPCEPDRPSYTEVESVVCGVTIARSVQIGDRPFVPDQVFQPNRQLDALRTRQTVGDAFLRKEGLEDPDWLGAALCDLNLCRTENDFRLWAEEHGFEGVENLFEYISKGRNAV